MALTMLRCVRGDERKAGCRWKKELIPNVCSSFQRRHAQLLIAPYSVRLENKKLLCEKRSGKTWPGNKRLSSSDPIREHSTYHAYCILSDTTSAAMLAPFCAIVSISKEPSDEGICITARALYASRQ